MITITCPALRYKERIAAKAKENERLGGKGSQKSVDLTIDTQKELAKMAGVSTNIPTSPDLPLPGRINHTRQCPIVSPHAIKSVVYRFFLKTGLYPNSEWERGGVQGGIGHGCARHRSDLLN